MNEQELPNLRGVGDLLIAYVASHVPDEIFCLVVPTDDANCSLEFSKSPDRRGINLATKTCKTKGIGDGVPAGSPMLKLDRDIESVKMSVL